MAAIIRHFWRFGEPACFRGRAVFAGSWRIFRDLFPKINEVIRNGWRKKRRSSLIIDSNATNDRRLGGRMSETPRRLLAAFVLTTVAGAALAGQVIVEKDPPQHARPRFFERVQAGDLADAVAKRGQVVDVPAGAYHLRVPCDSMVPGSFTDIKVTIDEHSLTRLRLTECGVELNAQPARR
jgi:hypothetical protein